MGIRNLSRTGGGGVSNALINVAKTVASGAGVKPSSTVTVFKNGTQAGTATANGSGAWSYTFGSALVSGDIVTYDAVVTSPAYTVAPTAPAAPTLAVSSGNTQATISWTDGANGGATITSHNIYRGTASGSLTLLGNITTGSPYTDTGLTNGAAYFYKLSAVNSAGESNFSSEVSVTPSVLTSEAVAYFAAMTVQPDAARKSALNAFIATAKTKSYWSKLDWFSFGASHDAQAALVNLKNPSQIAEVAGSPTFAADKGYLANGGSITLGPNLLTAGGGYSLNSAHLGIWNYTSNAASGFGPDIDVSAGGYEAAIYANYGGQMFTRPNSGTVVYSTSTALGHRGWTRTGATTSYAMVDAAAVVTDTTASSNVPDHRMALTGTRRAAAVHYGAGLTPTEWATLHADMGDYFNASGIIPAFDVFLVVGDSNNHFASGYDAAIDLASTSIWAHTITTGGGAAGEEPTRSVAPNWFAGDSTKIGYDIAFLRDFYITNGRLTGGRKVLIIKTSLGGSGLFTGSQVWRPGNSGFQNAVAQAKEVLAVYPGAQFKAILGCEGANDATDSADPTAFATQYDAMLNGFRAQIPGATNVPIIMAGIPPNYLGTGTATGLQAQIAAMPSRLTNAAYANPSSPTVLNHSTDPIHYDAQDVRGTAGAPGGLAGRFWTAYSSLGL